MGGGGGGGGLNIYMISPHVFKGFLVCWLIALAMDSRHTGSLLGVSNGHSPFRQQRSYQQP